MPPEVAPETGALIAPLNKILVRALRALGDAGEKDAACKLAADGWALLRAADPQEAERLNGALHYLTRDRFAKKEKKDERGTTMPPQEDPAMPTKSDTILDVREMVPARRHEIIFETYFALKPGSAFVLVNDHDPKPLYYQFAAEHPGEFSWDAVESGPVQWRVRIGRTEAAKAG